MGFGPLVAWVLGTVIRGALGPAAGRQLLKVEVQERRSWGLGSLVLADTP